jgi:hypothetical protein
MWRNRETHRPQKQAATGHEGSTPSVRTSPVCGLTGGLKEGRPAEPSRQGARVPRTPGNQGLELLETGRLTLPMPKRERERVMAIHTGQRTFEETIAEIDQVERLSKGLERTPLPAEPDRSKVTGSWSTPTGGRGDGRPRRGALAIPGMDQLQHRATDFRLASAGVRLLSGALTTPGPSSEARACKARYGGSNPPVSLAKR